MQKQNDKQYIWLSVCLSLCPFVCMFKEIDKTKKCFSCFQILDIVVNSLELYVTFENDTQSIAKPNSHLHMYEYITYIQVL